MASWDEALVRFAFDFARRVTGHDADAEDLAQEALLELAEAAPSHVGERAFVGRRIVLGAKMLRRANLTRARHERAVARQGVEGRGEEGAEARDALDLLDADDRHAVELRFLHGLSYAEVAHVLGVSEPAARMRVHRALGALRARLGPRAESMVAALPLFVAPRLLGLHTAQAAALAGGGLVMKKIVAVLLLLALAGGGVVASRAMRAPSPSRVEPTLPVAAQPLPTDPPLPTVAAPVPEAPPIPVDAGDAAISGRIFFEDGEPLRRMGLKVYGGKSRTAETDAEGRFRLDAQPGDRLLCLVHRKDSFVSIARAQVKEGEPLALDVALLRGTLLEGTVVMAGSPVRNATVALDRPGARATGTVQGAHGVCVTDDEGGFAFPYLPDGLYSLSVTRYGIEPGYAEVDVKTGLPPQTVTVRGARPLTIRIVSMPRSWIGKPRSFMISSLDRRPLFSFHTLSPDELGVMVVAEAPRPGRYALADLPGGTREFTITEVEVPEIVIDLSGFGRVVGRVSAPCRVEVGAAGARTDAEGRYEIDLVPPGDAEVSVIIGSATLNRPGVTVPAAGELRLDIELRGVTVRGRFVGDVHSSGVVIQRAGSSMVAQSRIDEAGRFEIPFIEPGEYEVIAWTGEARGEPRPVAVGHEDIDIGDLLLDPGVDVPVVVSAPAGVRLAGSWQLGAWQDGRGGTMLSLSLDEGGRGKVRLRPGRWRLSLGFGDLEQVSVDVEVPVREPVRFELTR